jgi:CheY-like chemotaxis protein
MSDLRGMRLLLVDDERDNQQLFTAILEHYGAVVTSARTGADGLRLFREQSFDAIVTDIAMPSMDGLTMVRQMRALPQGQHMPIFVLTAFSDLPHRLQAHDLGIAHYLVKPIEARRLRDELRAVFKQTASVG